MIRYIDYVRFVYRKALTSVGAGNMYKIAMDEYFRSYDLTWEKIAEDFRINEENGVKESDQIKNIINAMENIEIAGRKVF